MPRPRRELPARMIFIAVAIDLFADGVMVGTGSTVRFTLALMLGLAQLPANMPEGFATIATRAYRAAGAFSRWHS